MLRLARRPPGKRLCSLRAPGLELSLAVILMCVMIVPVARADSTDDELIQLSLEDLLEVRLTSVSKKSQSLQSAPAAAFVITPEDIRRSGATTLPEVLRMVPGVQVAQIDSNKWAVTARGFNGRFANNLLVLIDGRSVYTPLFSGVFWDSQDVLLEDIKRIEVIRGPGATLWGANAVNGVINVITRNAAESQSGLLSAGFGDEEKAFGAFRYGGKAGERGHYRVYAKYSDRDGSVARVTGAETADEWQIGTAGFRVDLEHGQASSSTVQGDVYSGELGATYFEFSPSLPGLVVIDGVDDVSGGNLLYRWDRRFEASELTLQTYYDWTDRQGPLLDLGSRTIDVDLQHRMALNDRHELVWGANARLSDLTLNSTPTVAFAQGQRDDRLFGLFVQDDIRISDRLQLSVGSKFEDSDYSGFEVQPGVRLAWSPRETDTVWASVARAVRTPSAGEQEARITGLFGVLEAGNPQNPFPVPLALGLQGQPDFASEDLIAYETGYRTQIGEKASIDVALFYNDYEDLAEFQPGPVTCEPGGISVQSDPGCVLTSAYVFGPVLLSNTGEARAHGVELATDWRPLESWRLQLSYTYLDVRFRKPDDIRWGRDPENSLSLRSNLDLGRRVELDLWLRYVDELPGFGFDAETDLDVRLGWNPIEALEISLVGRHLLDRSHPEFVSELSEGVPTEVERSVFCRLAWKF